MRKNITSTTGVMAAAATSLITLSLTLAMASSAAVHSTPGDGLRPAVTVAASAGLVSASETNWG